VCPTVHFSQYIYIFFVASVPEVCSFSVVFSVMACGLGFVFSLLWWSSSAAPKRDPPD
jgi:hypothetical protein